MHISLFFVVSFLYSAAVQIIPVILLYKIYLLIKEYVEKH